MFFSNTYTPLKVPHVHGQSTPSAKFKPIGEFRTFRTFEELEFLKWNDLDHGWIGWIILFRLYPYLEPIRGFLYLLQIDSSSTSSSNLNRLSQRVKYPWTSLTIYPILKLGKSPINILGSLVNTVLKTNRIEIVICPRPHFSKHDGHFYPPSMSVSTFLFTGKKWRYLKSWLTRLS